MTATQNTIDNIARLEGTSTVAERAAKNSPDARRRRMAAADEKSRRYNETLAAEAAARPAVTDDEATQWAARMVAAAEAGEIDRYSVASIRKQATQFGALTDELAAALAAVEAA